MAVKEAVRRKPRGLARLWSILWLRRGVQLYFVLFLAKVAIEKMILGEDSPAPAPEAFSPFGGFEGVFKFVATSGLFIAHTHWSNYILAAGVLAMTLATKSTFCGWVCPFGALQEWIGALAKFLGVKQRVPAAWLDRTARYLKYAVFVWATTGAAIAGVMVFRDVDPFHALIAPAEAGFGASSIALAITLLASVFTNRPFCKYACPLGSIVGVIGRASLMKVERDADACTNCGLCDRKCPMQVKVSTSHRIATTECNNCLTCVEVCPVRALEPKLVGIGGNKNAA